MPEGADVYLDLLVKPSQVLGVYILPIISIVCFLVNIVSGNTIISVGGSKTNRPDSKIVSLLFNIVFAAGIGTFAFLTSKAFPKLITVVIFNSYLLGGVAGFIIRDFTSKG